MRGSDIKLLREMSDNNFSNREMAQMLGINERTLINWENSNDELTQPYQTFLGQVFEDVIIKKAQEILDRLFKVVPSEYLALWFYLDHGKIVLFRNTARHHNVSKITRETKKFSNDEVLKDLDDISLTTASVAYATIINEAGEAICTNKYKAYKGTRYVHYLYEHRLESILKLPRFKKGPKPLYLLSAENKLEKDGSDYKVIKAVDERKIFTEEDLQAYTEALEKEEEKGLTELLTMFFG